MHCSSLDLRRHSQALRTRVCRRFNLVRNTTTCFLLSGGSRLTCSVADRCPQRSHEPLPSKSPKLIRNRLTVPLQRNLTRLFVSWLNTSRLRWSLLAVLDTPYPSGTLNAPRPDLATGVICGPPCLSSARVSSLVVPFRGEFRRSQLAATLGRRFLISGELPLPSRGLASTTGSASLILQRPASACKSPAHITSVGLLTEQMRPSESEPRNHKAPLS